MSPLQVLEPPASRCQQNSSKTYEHNGGRLGGGKVGDTKTHNRVLANGAAEVAAGRRPEGVVVLVPVTAAKAARRSAHCIGPVVNIASLVIRPIRTC